MGSRSSGTTQEEAGMFRELVILFFVTLCFFLVTYFSVYCVQIADGLLDKNGKPNEKTPSEWYRAAMKTPDSKAEGKKKDADDDDEDMEDAEENGAKSPKSEKKKKKKDKDGDTPKSDKKKKKKDKDGDETLKKKKKKDK